MKKTGWHRHSTLGAPMPNIVWVPSAWEEVLTKFSLTETAAQAEIEARTPTGKTLRKWIRGHYHKKFVPEAVLEAAGISTEYLP